MCNIVLKKLGLEYRVFFHILLLANNSMSLIWLHLKKVECIQLEFLIFFLEQTSSYTTSTYVQNTAEGKFQLSPFLMFNNYMYCKVVCFNALRIDILLL